MRSHYATNRKRSKQRKAKERIRLARATEDRSQQESLEIEQARRVKPRRHSSILSFRVTVECLTDGEKASFVTADTPHGLTISPTLCGKRVSHLIQHYQPVKTFRLTTAR